MHKCGFRLMLAFEEGCFQLCDLSTLETQIFIAVHVFCFDSMIAGTLFPCLHPCKALSVTELHTILLANLHEWAPPTLSRYVAVPKPPGVGRTCVTSGVKTCGLHSSNLHVLLLLPTLENTRIVGP